MIDLTRCISRIEALLASGDEASLTYAALEARLALERVCYDRLRQHHSYIAHDDLRRWQPAGIVKQLSEEVNTHVASTFTLSISDRPADDSTPLEHYTYVEVGRQIGFDPAIISKLWNALSRLALHITVPEKADDPISDFGDSSKIKAKVESALSELRRLSQGTMTSTDHGALMLIECPCGATTKRPLTLLQEGQAVSCINPDCGWSWTAHEQDGNWTFKRQEIAVLCAKCQTGDFLPVRPLLKMTFGQACNWTCAACDELNIVRLIFGQKN